MKKKPGSDFCGNHAKSKNFPRVKKDVFGKAREESLESLAPQEEIKGAILFISFVYIYICIWAMSDNDAGPGENLCPLDSVLRNKGGDAELWQVASSQKYKEGKQSVNMCLLYFKAVHFERLWHGVRAQRLFSSETAHLLSTQRGCCTERRSAGTGSLIRGGAWDTEGSIALALVSLAASRLATRRPARFAVVAGFS